MMMTGETPQEKTDHVSRATPDYRFLCIASVRRTESDETVSLSFNIFEIQWIRTVTPKKCFELIQQWSLNLSLFINATPTSIHNPDKTE
jgi:hypothetical protein